jgi:hypothetical protein
MSKLSNGTKKHTLKSHETIPLNEASPGPIPFKKYKLRNPAGPNPENMAAVEFRHSLSQELLDGQGAVSG